MKKLLTVAALSAVLAFGSVAAQAQELKIGLFNYAYVLSKIPQTKAAQAKVQKALDSKKRALDKMEADYNNLQKALQNPGISQTDALKKQRDLQMLEAELKVKISEFREEEQKIAGKEQMDINQKVQAAIDQVAKKKNLSVVFRSEGAVYLGDDTLDISEEVISVVSKSK